MPGMTVAELRGTGGGVARDRRRSGPGQAAELRGDGRREGAGQAAQWRGGSGSGGDESVISGQEMSLPPN